MKIIRKRKTTLLAVKKRRKRKAAEGKQNKMETGLSTPVIAQSELIAMGWEMPASPGPETIRQAMFVIPHGAPSSSTRALSRAVSNIDMRFLFALAVTTGAAFDAGWGGIC